MKKLNILSILLFLLFLSTFSLSAQKIFISSVAANKEATHITIDEKDIVRNYFNSASQQKIEIESNLTLHAKSNQSWCKPSIEGKVVTIAVDANSGTNKRNAIVTVFGKDNKSATIEVIQLGSGAGILVNEKEILLGQAAKGFSLGITSSTSFTITKPDWVKGPTPSPGIGFNTYEFTLEAATPGVERKGEITIKSTNSDIDEIKIPISQTHSGNPRFAVISDIHFGNSWGEGPNVKVPKALKNIFSKEPLVDALFVVGDLTDSGSVDQYNQLLKVFNNKTIVPENMPVYFLMGNHDNYSDGNAVTNYSKLGQPLHQYIEIKGYPFITISMTGKYTDSYDASTQAFLKEKLADAATTFPGKPIFIFMHVPPKYTVYGANEGWGTDKFLSILNNYPQAVVFSGHSHFPLGDPRSIHQDKFTTVNDGSTTYSEIESGLANIGIHPERAGYVTEGVIVNVDSEMNIEMERWDTYRNVEILPRWNVKAPHNGSNFAKEYKGRTGGEAPKFATNEKPVVSDVETESCIVTFNQAKDDEVVHHYVIELINKSNQVVTKFTKFSEFYLNTEMPVKFEINLNGIPTGATLKARVTALDSYKNKSEPIVSEEFKTGEYNPAPGSSKPAANTLLLDVVFGENGTATDNSSYKNAISKGSTTPETYLNSTYNRWVAKFPGSSSCFYKFDYKNNNNVKNAFSNGFTFETLYMTNTTGNVCPMSAQESGGAGIEQASGGQIQFYVRIGGSYQIIKGSVNVETGKYYHVLASYDKASGKARLYVNGSSAGELSVSGNFGFPSESAQWIAIGGDASGGANAQYSLNGEVVLARMYNTAVTRDEVYWLYEEVK